MDQKALLSIFPAQLPKNNASFLFAVIELSLKAGDELQAQGAHQPGMAGGLIAEL